MLKLLLGFNPAWVLSGLMAIGWFGSTVLIMGKAKIDVVLAKHEATGEARIACGKELDDFAATVNGEADAEIAAGNAAAERIPMLKDRAQLALRCKSSPFCRKALEAALVPNNTTEDASGGE